MFNYSDFTIRVKAEIDITCAGSYCKSYVTAEGTVTLTESFEVDSIPDNHAVVQGRSFVTPKGWSSAGSEEYYCPDCTEKRTK